MLGAVKEGNFQNVKWFVESGVNVNQKDNEGNTALYYASSFSWARIVKYLFEHGAEINYQNWEGETALHRACRAGGLEIVKYLVERGANINVKNREQKTALHRACKYGSLEMVKYLIERGAEVHCQNWRKNTALHRVCKSGSLEMVKYLVEHGADVNSKNWKGDTCLHRAVRSGSLEKVKYLIEHGGDTRCRNNQIHNALDCAVQTDSLPLVECLLGATYKTYIRKMSFFNRLCEQGKEQIISHFLKNGCSQDIFSDHPHGRSFLSIACYEGSTTLVRSLLKCDVDLRKEKELICGNDEIVHILNAELNKSVKHQEKIKILKGLDNGQLEKFEFSLKYSSTQKSLLLGKGSDGTMVHVGVMEDGSEVAVKRMLKLACEDTATNEADILRFIDTKKSPFIVSYRNFFQDKTFMYLIVDLCEESLEEHVNKKEQEHLQEHGPRMIKEILTGLEFLHDQGILHRDLKPSNILVDIEGKMRLADFGISRVLNNNETTVNTKGKGTEGWMPAEVIEIRNKGVVGRFKKKSDIQVAGMIAFFILTKCGHPFGPSLDRMKNILSGNPVNLDTLEDRDARDFVSWLISGDIRNRPYAHEALKHIFVVHAKDIKTLPIITLRSDNDFTYSCLFLNAITS